MKFKCSEQVTMSAAMKQRDGYWACHFIRGTQLWLILQCTSPMVSVCISQKLTYMIESRLHLQPPSLHSSVCDRLMNLPKLYCILKCQNIIIGIHHENILGSSICREPLSKACMVWRHQMPWAESTLFICHTSSVTVYVCYWPVSGDPRVFRHSKLSMDLKKPAGTPELTVCKGKAWQLN